MSDQGPPRKPSDGTREISDDQPKVYGFWDKLNVLGRPISGISAALAVAAIGYFGQQTIAERGRTELFTQLMSQREQAESSLRSSMFTTILGQFFDPESAREPASVRGDIEEVTEQLLKLELLALNFGESLSLSPLFRQVNREITRLDSATEDSLLEDARDRLHSLAHRVSDWQLSALAANGSEFRIEVPYEDPKQEISFPEYELYDVHELDGIRRGVRVVISRIDEIARTVRINLHVVLINDDGSENGYEIPPRSFSLDYFDFPMIDNTRLSGGHRFALVLGQAGPDDEGVRSVEASGIFFEGMFTSQRDKPVFNEIVLQLAEEKMGD